uniref:Uncharacterized protein n=1 Tax=Helianthus annuus TaxID=4232 RepID=A0A251RRC5_HELAN
MPPSLSSLLICNHSLPPSSLSLSLSLSLKTRIISQLRHQAGQINGVRVESVLSKKRRWR